MRCATITSCWRRLESPNQQVEGSIPSRRTNLQRVTWPLVPRLVPFSPALSLGAVLREPQGFSLHQILADRAVAFRDRDGAVAENRLQRGCEINMGFACFLRGPRRTRATLMR